MLYNISLNAVKMQERGIELKEATVFYAILQAKYWAKFKIFDGEEYYYISSGKIAKEVPSVSPSKSSILRTIKKLHDIGLINRIFDSNKTYYKVSQFGDTGCPKFERQ